MVMLRGDSLDRITPDLVLSPLSCIKKLFLSETDSVFCVLGCWTGSSHVTVATAFLLALFSHTLNHVIIRLQSALYDRQNPNKLLESGMTEGGWWESGSECSNSECLIVGSMPTSILSSDQKQSCSQSQNQASIHHLRHQRYAHCHCHCPVKVCIKCFRKLIFP